MVRSLVFIGILFLAFSTWADTVFTTLSALQIDNMASVQFKTAVKNLELEDFNNLNVDKQNAIIKRAQKELIELPFIVPQSKQLQTGLNTNIPLEKPLLPNKNASQNTNPSVNTQLPSNQPQRKILQPTSIPNQVESVGLRR